MDLATDGTGLYWSDADGDLPPAIVDGRVAMFSDGPYYMGLLKSGVPDQAGKWKVAIHPYSKQQGSYLGGTGLSIPVSSKHQEAAWLLTQFMLQPEQQMAVFTVTGAAPATLAALQSPELTQPDDVLRRPEAVRGLPRGDVLGDPLPVRGRSGRRST